MKHTNFVLTALLVLIVAPAHAQFFDEFTGGKLGPLWTFTVPGNTPADTADPARLSLHGGSLHLTLQRGSLPNGTAHNVLTVPAAPDSHGDYAIETKVSASFDKVDGYPIAGLIVLADTKNFVYYSVCHNNFKTATATGPANYNFATVSGILGGKVDTHKNPINLSSDYANIGAGPAPQPVTLTITKTGQTITFSYASANGKAGKALTLTAADTGDKQAAYLFLSTLAGKRVGLYADSSYTETTETVSFGYFHLVGLKPARP